MELLLQVLQPLLSLEEGILEKKKKKVMSNKTYRWSLAIPGGEASVAVHVVLNVTESNWPWTHLQAALFL